MTAAPPGSPLRTRILGSIALIGLLALPCAGAQATLEQDVETAARQAARDLDAAIDKMQPLVERYGYVGVGAAVSVEGFGIPAPGQTLLMAGALEAGRGKMNMGLLLTIAVLAAVLGNSLGYLIGRRGGRPLLRKLRVNEAHEARLTALFDRYGGGFILLARFFDGPRQLNGILAGMLNMPWWLFTVFNIAGALLWVAIWGLGTLYLSEHAHALHGLLRRINPWIAATVALGAVALLVYLFKGRRG
jgi:membrane protein DedA with SNARE-associated domain